MPKWPTDWKSEKAPTLPVVMVCTRDEAGIDYEVRVTEKGGSGFEEGENEVTVWSTRRDFSQRPECRAGGDAFIYAAEQQQEIADAWAVAICKVEGLDPNEHGPADRHRI